MSILKQVLSDAWSSVVRKPAPEKSRDRLAVSPPQRSQAVRARGAGSASGLKVVILNWKSGENDPFTVATNTLRQHFHACGKNVEVVEITEGDWPTQVGRLAREGIEFAFTWQGLGSSAKLRDTNESLWTQLKIPLICVHGDHPSHMPLNHELESRYCFHLYTNADFARYSNTHFRTMRSASVIDLPQLHRESPLRSRTGNYFVVAKNITDPVATERAWRERLPKPVYEAFMMSGETLKSRITREPYVELHDCLDDLILRHNLEWLTAETNPVGYHDYHSQLDHYLRSFKAGLVVAQLRDFPLRIYGRGWDGVAQSAPAGHLFGPGRNMADSQELYYSTYGLVDVSPSKGLHDRTRRAMTNGTGFLSSANIEDSFADTEHFASLFFSFGVNDLPEKASAVVRDPRNHAALAREFGSTYHNRFHFRAFVNQLDHLAKIATDA